MDCYFDEIIVIWDHLVGFILRQTVLRKFVSFFSAHSPSAISKNSSTLLPILLNMQDTFVYLLRIPHKVS